MARFFVDQVFLQENQISLIGDNAAHAKVLRLRKGENVVVCDGAGTECTCVVEQMTDREVLLSVLTRQCSESEPCISVSLYVGLPKGDKLEHVIQKATELGVYEIVTFPTNRSITKLDEKSLRKKLDRWQKIAAAAAEQSGRGRIPIVRVLNSYCEAVAEGAQADLPILFYENEHAMTLRMVIDSRRVDKVVLMTGPEGGLENEEVSMAKDMGYYICTLGKRILRCETAPLCALSAVMYAAGEF